MTVKKKIAVFVTAMYRNYAHGMTAGLREVAQEKGYTLYFVNTFGGLDTNELDYDTGEAALIHLLEPSAFDGIVLMRSTILNPIAVQYIDEFTKRALAMGIPTVSICYDMNTVHSLHFDESLSIRELVDHFIEKHGCQRVAYLSGPLNNGVARTRLQNYLQAMKAHGITPDDSMICYGHFMRTDGEPAAQFFTGNGAPLPDAVICANDEMAMGLYEALDARGICVPKQVAISGIDCTPEAMVHAPTMTSVDFNKEELGRKAMRTLDAVIHGKEMPMLQPIKTTVHYGQSCGCGRVTAKQQKAYISHLYKNEQAVERNFVRLRDISAAFSGTEDYNSLRTTLLRFAQKWELRSLFVFVGENSIKPPLDSANLMDASKNPVLPGLQGPAPVRMVFSYLQGRVFEEEVLPSSQILPEQIAALGEDMVMSALHSRSNIYGYALFDVEHVSEFILQSFTCMLGGTLENMTMHATVQTYAKALERMYMRDPLTNLLNRRGYGRSANALFEKALYERRELMVVSTDMDHLKHINDTYGHHEGDEAIKAMAACLSATVRPHDVCTHLSGDEFMVIATDRDSKQMLAFMADVQARIDAYNAASGKPYKLSASLGGCAYVPDPHEDLEHMTIQADNAMYAVKKLHHKQLEQESDV